MRIKSITILLALTGSALGLALPAVASPYATFAQYKEETNAKDFSFNSATKTLSSIPGKGQAVEFAFLNPALSSLSNIDANLTFSATSSQAATSGGGLYIQPGLNGSFMFVSTEAVTIGGQIIPSGTLLLKGVFTNGVLSASGGAGSVIDDTVTLGPIVWTSGITAISANLLTFDPAAHNSFSFGLSNVEPKAGKNFTSTSVGTFDTALLKGGDVVPEPATAGVLLLGVALAASSRRRVRSQG